MIKERHYLQNNNTIQKLREILMYCRNEDGNINFRELIPTAHTKNISREEINRFILILLIEGEIYESQRGILRFAKK